MINDKDYCAKCYWNDPDLGCFVRSDEMIYQCKLYQANHPAEVKQFEEDMKDWHAESEV